MEGERERVSEREVEGGEGAYIGIVAWAVDGVTSPRALKEALVIEIIALFITEARVHA